MSPGRQRAHQNTVRIHQNTPGIRPEYARIRQNTIEYTKIRQNTLESPEHARPLIFRCLGRAQQVSSKQAPERSKMSFWGLRGSEAPFGVGAQICQNTSEYARIHQNTPEYVQNTPEYAQKTLEYGRTHQNTPRLRKNTLKDMT